MEENTNLYIGLVGPLPPPFGGMANQTRQLLTLLQSEGIHVSLVQTNAVYKPKVVRKFKRIRAFFRLVPYLYRLWRLAGQVDVIHVLANSGWSWQLFAAPAVWIGKLRRTPVVVNYRGGEARAYFEKAFKWVRPTMIKGDALIVPSSYLEKVFADFGLKTETMPNVINLERFRPKEESAVSNPRAPHLVVTRNLEPIYDVSTAINAVSLLSKTIPGVRLSIAGSGPQERELKRLVKQLGLQDVVVFTGKLSPDEIAELYRNADILLNPSTVDNMPNSILESLASGVPVVTTNVGGVPYVVEHEKTALMVEVGDAKGMAKEVARLLENPTLYRRLAENGREDVRQYAWPHVREKWLGLYHRLAVAPSDETNQSPKLLVFSSLFPHAGAPNNGVFIRERMFRVGQKIAVIVVSPQPWFPGQGLIRLFRPHFRPQAPKQELHDSVNVFYPRFFSVPFFFKYLDGLSMALSAYPMVRRMKKNNDINMIDSHFTYPDGYAATLLGKWLQLPVTITLRGTEIPHSNKPRLRSLLVRALERADHLFSVSDSLRQRAIALGIAPSKITVVGNGVDTTKFFPVNPQQARQRYDIPQQARVMISVGALVKRKGFHRVIEILPNLLKTEPDLHYLIVGGPSPEGDRRGELEHMVKALRLEERVHFLGAMPSTELKWPLSAADLFVLATANEGWANVFLEAMACGLPVVTTEVGGNGEVVCRPELGTVVPFGDQQRLQDALLAALARNWDRNAIRAYAEANTWDDRIECLIEEFRSMIAGEKKLPSLNALPTSKA